MIDFGVDWAYAIRLIAAATLGALIGLEREIHDHPAGMRTHLLVSLGSAGFTVLSTAAVGMAAGAGAWLTAVSITVIVIVSLWPLRRVADRVIGRDPHIVRMRL